MNESGRVALAQAVIKFQVARLIWHVVLQAGAAGDEHAVWRKHLDHHWRADIGNVGLMYRSKVRA